MFDHIVTICDVIHSTILSQYNRIKIADQDIKANANHSNIRTRMDGNQTIN